MARVAPELATPRRPSRRSAVRSQDTTPSPSKSLTPKSATTKTKSTAAAAAAAATTVTSSVKSARSRSRTSKNKTDLDVDSDSTSSSKNKSSHPDQILKLELTSTPRHYPLLRKDIEVSDKFVDKNGDISLAKLTNRPYSPQNRSIGAKKGDGYATDTTQSRYQQKYEHNTSIKPMLGRDLYQPMLKSEDNPDQGSNLFLRALLLIILFIGAIAGIWALYSAMPPIQAADKANVKLPRSIEEAKALSLVVDKYKDQYPVYIFALFAATYVFLQAFAIPGAVFLSILAGPIWGVARGIVIISLVATTGSSVCFLISKTIARPIFQHFFPDRIAQFKTQLDQNRDNLFFYLLFLRIAPVFPNWLITLSSPIIDVPYIHFAVATFIGIMPNNFVMTTLGSGLQNMTNQSSLMTPQSIAALFGISLAAVLPILLKNVFSNKEKVE